MTAPFTYQSESDKEIQRRRQLGIQLGIPHMPDLHVAVKVVDKDGKVLEDRYEQGHSWTRNAYNMFATASMCSSSAAATISDGHNTNFRKGILALRNTNGTEVIDTSGNGPIWYMNAFSTPCGYSETQSGVNNFGILIGTSSEPFHPEDFNLHGLIYSGSGSGQLLYQPMSRAASQPVYNASTQTWSCTMTRVWNNNSSGTILVNEVGLVCASGVNTSYFMTSRDVISTIIVPVGAQLTISVIITSMAFTTWESTFNTSTSIALGTQIYGGTYLGWCYDWVNSTGNPNYYIQPSYVHTKYALILSPKSGGESSTALQAHTSATGAPTGANNRRIGLLNVNSWAAVAVNSAIQQFCNSANASNLGGYNDWFIPAEGEMCPFMYNRHLIGTSAIPSGEALRNANHWTSSVSTSSLMYYANPTTGASATSAPNNTSYVRLVRRQTIT